MTSEPQIVPTELGIEGAMDLAIDLQIDDRLEAAGELYARINVAAPEYPDAWHFRGLVEHQLGHSEEAIAFIQKAIGFAPDYADAHNNLGNVYQQVERNDEAIACYQRALAIKPDLVDAHFNLGKAYEVTHRIDEALTCYRQALLLAPFHFDSYSRLGALLYSSGRVDEAAQVYQKWVSLDPQSAYARHMMAACTDQDVPDRASDGCVQTIFDRFADSFDSVLERLEYRAPALVVHGIGQVIGDPTGRLDVLDVGCGTGLCGAGLKQHARRLVGVDLSPEMLKKAETRKVYDELVTAELTAYLQSQAQAWDLIASADTLVYFGDLGPVMKAAAQALKPGGHIAFTVERASEDLPRGFRINPHGRYSHSDAYLRAAMEAAGLQVQLIAGVHLRLELKKHVEGLLAVARR